MAAVDQQESEKMLDWFIYDYLLKRNMNTIAEMFATEAEVNAHSIASDSFGGFLTDWWIVFWDMYSTKFLRRPQAMNENSVQDKPTVANQFRNAHTMQSPHMNQQRNGQVSSHMQLSSMQIQNPVASQLDRRVHEEAYSRLPSANFNVNACLPNVDKSAGPSYSQQFHNGNTQQQTSKDELESNIGNTVRMNSTLDIASNADLPRGGHHDMGLEGRTCSVPVNRRPLANKSYTSMTHPQNGQLMSQTIAQTPSGLVPCSEGDTGNFKNQLLEGNDNNGQIMPERGFSVQPTPSQRKQTTQKSPRRRRSEQIKIGQPAMQQSKDQPTPQAFNGRKRRGSSMSEDGKSSLVDNTPEDKGDSLQKDVKVEKPVDYDDIGSFFSNDEAENHDATPSLSNSGRNSAAIDIKGRNGVRFQEAVSLNSFQGKVLCCDFSSNGKLLAIGGHDKKVTIWDMESLDYINAAEENTHLITDVRFRPDSNVFATSSFDRTVRIWDSNDLNKSILKLDKHGEQVTSLDFHPRNSNLLCSCDIGGEIRLWDVKQSTCASVFQGASRQVRFQPESGDLLAAAFGNRIGLFDIKSNKFISYLEGHGKDVRSMCWDVSGQYLVSVSEDSARVWSIAKDKVCIQLLQSDGSKFESCTLHPLYSSLVVIGSYQTLILWNPKEATPFMPIPSAHGGLIASLANCAVTGTISSTGHDKCVKLWK
ncbi:transcriptional corepressor LEUNIG-like [Impatiens glandulifera]|uniref:transcriptional corepressor LEUNIG-like n=1 Tax=Impatiens glandulifera TaxID=253017 RepID=UPI001FB19515|nr:transcriptional corepressor LEUNIG-like [Impatiens glandulifera]